MNKTNFIYYSALSLASLLSINACKQGEKQDSGESKRETGKPHILLICADDLGWSDLGCYGSEINTPNLDRLARNGLRFTNFHNTSKCFPSRACLLTGLYAQQCNMARRHDSLKNSITLGELLKGAGYRTLMSGKHHGLENMFHRGFDHYYGLRDGCCNYFNPGDQRPGEPKPVRKKWAYPRKWCIDDTTLAPYTPQEDDFYTTDYFTKYALKWLEEYKDEDKPFFLYLAYTAPHDPLQAWEEDIAKYLGIYREGYEAIRKKRYKKQQASGLLDERFKLSSPDYDPWQDLTEDEKLTQDSVMAVYAAMIERMDMNIGKILEKLRQTGKYNNTLIMFVSDNGASAEVVNMQGPGSIGSMSRWTSLGRDWANVSNTPFRYYKNYSYEGGIRTPFIAWWPEGIKNPGRTSNFAGHFIDFMATFVDICDADYPKHYNNEDILPYEGKSLLNVFQDKKTTRKDPLFWQWNKGKAMLEDSMKIVKHGKDTTWNLYHMLTDPAETTDLSGEYPGKVREMDRKYHEWFSNTMMAKQSIGE